MAEQYKKIAFLVPRPGMDTAAFLAYWVGTHGPTVAGSPGYGQWRKRYVQNHVLGAGPVGEPFGFAGMAMFWLPGDSPNEDAFATSAIYRDRIAVDERRFIDMQRTVSMAAIEDIIEMGTGPAKLVILSRRAPGLEAADLRRRHAAELVGAARAAPGFAQRLAGWRVNHVVEGSFRLPGARPAAALAVDLIEEFWFASAQALNAAFASVDYAQQVAPVAARLFSATGRQSFVAREAMFFDGVPVMPA